MAMQKISVLVLQYNTAGGAPIFITKFRDALNDLKDAQEPVSDVMAKSMFLSKIQDNNYRHIVDALLITNDNFEDCVQRILDKHNLMTHSIPQAEPRKANNTCQGNSNNRQNNNANNGQGGNNRNSNSNSSLPP
jgi:hypothetical protein